MKLLYYNCTFALFIFRLHKLGIEAHAYAHYTSLLCFALVYGVSRQIRQWPEVVRYGIRQALATFVAFLWNCLMIKLRL